MRKKLDTRFPAARIKKIMQVDEEVGKIAMTTPVLVSKALELFLQDLLDRAHNVMRDRCGKTLNSSHLKECLDHFKEYDFLGDIAAKISDVCPETPRAAASLEGPGSSSMGRSRRKRGDGDDWEEEDNGENSRRGHRVKQDECGSLSPPQGAPRGKMNRQLSSSSTKSADASDHLPPETFSWRRKDIKGLPESRRLQPAAHGSALVHACMKEERGFDLKLDLNASPELEESPTANVVQAPVQKACDSDEDYDAE